MLQLWYSRVGLQRSFLRMQKWHASSFVLILCRTLTAMLGGRFRAEMPRRFGGFFRNDADHRDFTAIGTAAGLSHIIACQDLHPISVSSCMDLRPQVQGVIMHASHHRPCHKRCCHLGLIMPATRSSALHCDITWTCASVAQMCNASMMMNPQLRRRGHRVCCAHRGLLFTVEEGVSFYSTSIFWRGFLSTGIGVFTLHFLVECAVGFLSDKPVSA